MLLFVGLGNPGQRYAGNRHNIGFMAVEAIAREHGLGPFRRAFHGLTAEGRLAGRRIALLMPQTFIQDGDTPKRKAFIEAYQKAYKVDRMPSAVSAAQGYDSILLLAAAIKQAGSTDGDKVRGALESLNTKIEGVVTTYNKPFTRDDHEAIKPNMVVMGEVKNGRVVLGK